MHTFAVRIDDSYWRRRYNVWNGNRGSIDDCTTYKTRAGAEKKAAELRVYLSKTNRQDLAKTVCVEELN